MDELQLAVEGPIARITLNRADRRNAVSQAMWRELERLCSVIADDPAILAVIVQGAGGHFCAGADIAEFDEVFSDLAHAKVYLGAIETALDALAALDRPTIAKIEGSAVGGGLAIALACDLRFTTDDAHMAIPPARLGLLYGPAETRLLVQTVGPAAAKEMLFGAQAIFPSEALRLGMVNRIVGAAELEDAVQAQAALWARLSSASIRGAKRAVQATLAGRDADVRALVESIAMDEDFKEGRAAFKQKRAPNFARRS